MLKKFVHVDQPLTPPPPLWTDMVFSGTPPPPFAVHMVYGCPQTQNLAWHTGENHQKMTKMTHIIRIRSQHYLDLRFCQITYCQKNYCPIAVCLITFCQKAVCQKTFCLLTDTPILFANSVDVIPKMVLQN